MRGKPRSFPRLAGGIESDQASTTGRRALLTGWEVVTVIVAPHLEANVGVRIAPKVRPHGVGRKTDRIRISGARTGTATAIHPVRRFRSGTARHDFDIMSRETRSLSDLPRGSVCACRAQREHRSNCRNQLCSIERIRPAGVRPHRSERKSQKIVHELAPLSVSSTYEGKGQSPSTGAQARAIHTRRRRPCVPPCPRPRPVALRCR